ncbi:CTP--2,3-di-O-geranylgeranyl-sn-glycero-1-phosphate cytidyltransferase [Candidatus Pacearchaeota archaeon]|nr:CTP--2,3-di-O-geranylgeranyl-sn-glycero-1-phosphate cytidyltransferase [Candidatus Pacearchaeota archaeon]
MAEWDLKKELKRKAIHLLAIFFIAIFILISSRFGKSLALFALVFLLIVFLELDYVRVEMRRKIPFISGLWRLKEKDRPGGQVFFLIGAIICLAVFDFRIALAAILMTVFGDMAAALIGKRFGRTWLSEKRALEGILAELFVNLAIGYFILNSWIVIIVMSLTATIVESLVDKLDDNLMIPLFAGFNGQLALYLINYLG